MKEVNAILAGEGTLKIPRGFIKDSSQCDMDISLRTDEQHPTS
jgi:hypothetical protein